MADIKKSGYMKYKDKAGNMYLMMPITNTDNVEGLDDLIKEAKTFVAEYNVTAASEIRAAFDAGKMVVAKVDDTYEYLYRIDNSGDLSNCHFASLSYDTDTDSVKVHFRTVVNSLWGTPKEGFFNPDYHASTHASDGYDPITPAAIGAATMTEVNAAIQSAIQNTWEASY